MPAPEADQRRSGSPSGSSTLITSAPPSASSLVQYAPAIPLLRSTTTYPVSGGVGFSTDLLLLRLLLALGFREAELRREPVVVGVPRVGQPRLDGVAQHEVPGVGADRAP